ncbi:MAG: hypothetical protein EB120_00955, partial [Proteobacteria bacterium]|nr:hypothetical protein [Pseudomonadota bacterium]
MKLYRPLLWFGGAVLFLAIAPFLGSETLHPTNLWDPDTLGYRIFWNLRYPRFILAMGAGGALAVLGAIYQNLFRNPLCEPYVLGISSAVTLGILVGEIIWGFLPMSWPSMGIGMVAAVLLIIFLLSFASSRFGTSSEKVVLFGLGINFILSSLLFLGLSFQSQNVGGGSLRWFFGF